MKWGMGSNKTCHVELPVERGDFLDCGVLHEQVALPGPEESFGKVGGVPGLGNFARIVANDMVGDPFGSAAFTGCIDADHDQAESLVPVLFMQFTPLRDGFHAWFAPVRPELKNPDYTTSQYGLNSSVSLTIFGASVAPAIPPTNSTFSSAPTMARWPQRGKSIGLGKS
jgi:hypothetical protein